MDQFHHFRKPAITEKNRARKENNEQSALFMQIPIVCCLSSGQNTESHRLTSLLSLSCCLEALIVKMLSEIRLQPH